MTVMDALRYASHIIPDEPYLKLKFRQRLHRKLNLKKPQTFNEKLQWLKLYDRRPEYTKMVDKYEAKKYVADIIGDQYIIPTLGVWDKFDDIDFDFLPDQFVLKCTHDSGGLVICTDKSKLDIEAAKKKITTCLKKSYYWHGREWPYKNVKPRIIAEQYMVDESGYELKDYKFFAFDGVAKAMFIASDRQDKDVDTKFDFFDMDFKHLPFTNGHPNADHELRCPESFEEMKRLAGKLSQGIPQVRVDFYDINGKVYFGELTFSHWSGFTAFDPEEWDYKFGEWIKLPDSAGGYLIYSKGYMLWLHQEEPKSTGLTDYKIWCFNGEPYMTLVCNDRFSNEGMHEDFYDMQWNHMEIQRPNHPMSKNLMQCPRHYELMKLLAKKLTEDLPFGRVDFYESNGSIYFGEITLFPATGMTAFAPEEWDYILGNKLVLPTVQQDV